MAYSFAFKGRYMCSQMEAKHVNILGYSLSLFQKLANKFCIFKTPGSFFGSGNILVGKPAGLQQFHKQDSQRKFAKRSFAMAPWRIFVYFLFALFICFTAVVLTMSKTEKKK